MFSSLTPSWQGILVLIIGVSFLISIYLYGEKREQAKKELIRKKNSLVNVNIRGKKEYVLKFIKLLEVKDIKFQKKPRKLTRRERKNLAKIQLNISIKEILLVSEAHIYDFKKLVKDFNAYGKKITAIFK